MYFNLSLGLIYNIIVKQNFPKFVSSCGLIAGVKRSCNRNNLGFRHEPYSVKSGNIV